jgi:hypothetical protein
MITLTSCFNEKESNSEVTINVWYGNNQTFGKNGNPQRQINILGNIYAEIPNIEAYFVLNNETGKRPLTLGSDLHRLAQQGDFNVEIERTGLNEGFNHIEIFVTDSTRIIKKKKVNFSYTGKNKWPLPYNIEWSEVEKIQDVAEVVDGHWEITENGIRTKFKYYDRVLAFGDSDWENYEVQTSVIFHDFTIPEKGPPTYNVSHVAIASRWPGHDLDSLQPNRKWFPVGATSEFRLTSNYDSCRWRIFDGEHFYAEQDTSAYRTIKPETNYFLKHRVETISNNQSKYSVKIWLAAATEPENWDFQAIEKNASKETGSALLIAHNTDVTFGNISIVPLQQSK